MVIQKIQRNVRFGELETRALFALEEAGTRFVTSAKLAALLRVSTGRANKLAWQLTRKRRLLRMKKGLFLFAPMRSGKEGLWTEHSLLLLPELMKSKEYYVGFWTALNHYGLTEQIPITVQVVCTSRQRNFEALQTRFLFFKARKLGEWREEKIGEKTVRFATIEQLMVDCLAYPENSGGLKEACKALWEARKKIDWVKLEQLASGSGDAVRRRLGYLSELLGLKKFKADGFTGWRWLDPSRTRKAVGRSDKWGLLLNVSEKALTDWRDS
jgi:predicted transcriptional regulator of viral defense system